MRSRPRQASDAAEGVPCAPGIRTVRLGVRECERTAGSAPVAARWRTAMEQRRLGRTGHMSSVVAFGAAGIGRVDQATADKAIQTALDYGVNHIDVAPSYGEAELRFHDWMPRIRGQVFLGCKTNVRDAEGSWAECNRSLERLNTDRFDLYQLHSVGKLDALDEVTRKGGALETLIKARDQGLTTWLGITGHTHDAPSTHLEALRRFDFDTVMLPLNFVLWSIPQYRRDF